MKTFKIFCLLAAFCCFCSCTGMQGGIFWKGETVEGTGLAAYDENDLVKTKANALTAAQRNAVEKVVGVFVSANTMSEQAVTINSQILTKTEGFIKKYRIAEEGREGKYYRVKIEAFVLADDISKAVSETPALQDSYDGKTLVSGTDKIDDTILSYQAGSSEIVKSITSQGISVSAGTKNNIDFEDTASLIEAGRASGAKFMAVYRGAAYKLNNAATAAGGFSSYRAKTDIKLLSLSNATIIYQNGAEASAVDASPKIAAEKALQKAAFAASENLGAQIKKAAQGVEEVELDVLKVGGLEQLKQFQSMLAASRGVDRQRVASYSGGDALFKVRLQGVSIDELLSSLMTKQIKFDIVKIETFKAQIRIAE